MAAPRFDGIVCYSTDPWGEMKRPGQLMRRLARRVPVLYVEPSYSLTSVARNWRTAASSATRERLRRGLSGRPREVEPGIHVLTSLISIPSHRLSALHSAGSMRRQTERQQRRAARAARQAAASLGMSRPLTWVTYPMPLDGVESDGSASLVYDCMDRWSDFPDALADAKWRSLVTGYERRLLETAPVVFCSAAGLYEAKRRTAAGTVVLLRNGADVQHFEPAGRPIPADLARLPRPLIGYVGAVAEWMDFELLRSVALLRPDWSLILVGPVFRGTTSGDAGVLRHVTGLPNVHMLGPRPYDEVPAYCEAFDVAMIPFLLNGLTEDTNPIKVYEYLAAGDPVVSTPLAEVATLPAVKAAGSAAEFVACCEAARRERADTKRLLERIRIAEENSWEARAEVAWQVVTERFPAA